ncbi:MAG: N-acetylmuramoyl-L-alanine amidase [Lachnospiraceae bacterium]|nr:N-acetylmuramoyl-L-alanine amidase [Lachnospiraceae bacterium]
MAVNVSAATVMIDPGHGGAGTEGAGAIYPPYMEKSLTLDVANQLCSELNAAGISAAMTRTSDVALSLPERAAIAKNAGAKLLVSIHFNASGPHDKIGSSVWVSMFGNHHKVGAECGGQILSQLTALGFVNKGIWTKAGSQGDYYGVVRYGTSVGIPTLIIEHCYMDNPTDRAILESVGTGGLAHADAAGITNFFGTAIGQSLANGTLDTTAANAASSVTVTAGAGKSVGSSGSSNLKTNFTDAEWQWLLSQWAYTGNAEAVMSQVPLSDLKALVDEHNKGNM